MTRFLVILLVLLGLVLVGCNVEDIYGPIQTVELKPITSSTAVPPTQPPATSEPTIMPPETSAAANADVLFVSATETAVGLWTFSVEISHPDSGWEDYADGWDVVLPDGNIAKANPDDLFTRLLLHPHENEQPFTRSQSNIPIPTEVTTVTVRAHDLVDGFGGQEVMVDLTAVSGDNFAVNRLD